MPRGVFKNGINKGWFSKGKPSAFKGRHHTQKSIEKNRKTNKGRHASPKTEFKKGQISPMKGKHHTKKANEKNRQKHLGKKHTEKAKRKCREWHINNPNKKFKDTYIELKIEAELQRRGINYQKQVPLCNIAIVDFYLPEYRIVIECDGDYWHNKPERKERDEEKTRVLIFNGFNVYRFWEHEINKSPQNCINKLLIK